MSLYRLIKTPFALLLALPIFIMQCDDTSNSTTGTESGVGELKVELTDAPFPADSVSEANVTINKIEIRSSEADSAEADTSDGEDEERSGFTTLSEETQSFNLLNLSNGVTATLADLEIEAGQYDQIRLYVTDAGITLNSGQEYDLKVPSGPQSGIKVNVDPDLEVEGGLTSELLLDFDVSKSFVMRGNPKGNINGFIFKPVIRAVNQSTAGRITGTVTHASEDTALSNANVWVAQDTSISNTFTDEDGNYSIIGLPEGSYDIHATKTDFDTTSIEEVSITAGNEREEDLVLSPLQ